MARLLSEGRLSLSDLAREVMLPPESLRSLLEGLPVRVEGESVVVEDRLRLLLEAWARGFDPIELALKAGWRDFERLCADLFNKFGYKTLVNFRLKHQGRYFEVDVLALREPWILAADCKRWRRLRSSSLRRAALLQKKRCIALANAIPFNRELSAEVRGWRRARVVPFIVNLHESDSAIHEGVPVVPLNKLASFLNDFELYSDELFVINVELSMWVL